MSECIATWEMNEICVQPVRWLDGHCVYALLWLCSLWS